MVAHIIMAYLIMVLVLALFARRLEVLEERVRGLMVRRSAKEGEQE